MFLNVVLKTKSPEFISNLTANTIAIDMHTNMTIPNTPLGPILTDYLYTGSAVTSAYLYIFNIVRIVKIILGFIIKNILLRNNLLNNFKLFLFKYIQSIL